MNKIIFAFPGNEKVAENIIDGIEAEKGEFVLHQFPDGETYIRIQSEVENKTAIVICTLNHPDDKLLALYFLCKLLKDLRVKSICLVAPYLAYMRQDKRFLSGEAITSEYFARLLESFIDQLIIVDPHLHRRASMNELYNIPTYIIHASALIAEWIKRNVENPLLIGPDSESEQWVSEIAKQAGAPFLILEKLRKGDEEVQISLPQVAQYKNHSPVLADDIISTAGTMLQTVKLLNSAGMKPAVCIGVHAVFANHAYNDLLNLDVKTIVTCNSIAHESNGIDVSPLLIELLKKTVV